MSNIKRNILGTIAGFSLIFMNNSNVTKSVNQLFLRINNGENLNSISILVSGIVQDLLLGISNYIVITSTITNIYKISKNIRCY